MLQPVSESLDLVLAYHTGRQAAPLFQLRAIPCRDRAVDTFSRWASKRVCLLVSSHWSSGLNSACFFFPPPSTFFLSKLITMYKAHPPPPLAALPLPDPSIKASRHPSTDLCFPGIETNSLRYTVKRKKRGRGRGRRRRVGLVSVLSIVYLRVVNT